MSTIRSARPTFAVAPPSASLPAQVATPPLKGRSSAAIDWTEFRHGWRILVIAMLGVGIGANSSMLYAFGSLVIPLQKAFGWERGELSLAITFLFAGAVFSAQLVGWLNQRYGMKRVTLLSLVALSMTFAAITLVGRSIGWLYLMFALLPVASLGTMQVTWTQIVNLWFERNRGLGLAIVLSGTGLAAVLIPSGVSWAVGRWGWQAAFVLLALLPVVPVLPLTARWFRLPSETPLPLGDRAVGPGNGTTVLGSGGGADAGGGTGIGVNAGGNIALPSAVRPGIAFADGIRSAKFWFLNIALCLVIGAIVTMVTSTVPLLRDKGLSAADASKVFGGFGLSLIFGRVVVGYLVDRLWAPGVAAVALALPALGCFLLWSTGAAGFGTLVAATFLVGIGAGAEFDIAAYLVSRYFGLRDYGRLFGVHLGLITASAALAPLLFGAIYKTTGGYTMTLLLCGGAFLAGAAMLLPLGRAPTFTEPTGLEPTVVGPTGAGRHITESA